MKDIGEKTMTYVAAIKKERNVTAKTFANLNTKSSPASAI